MKIGELGEKALLERLRARIASSPDVPIGPGDDAAAVRTGDLTLLTTDVLVEGLHFKREWSPPELLGRKALSVNLSDIAAMAGRPRFATISLCLPADVELSWLDALYDGLTERANEAGVAIVGGNLSGIAGPVVIDVTLAGQSDRPLQRRGGRPGDVVAVTGTLGAAASALPLLERGARLGAGAEDAVQRCLRAHLDPAPPLAFGAALASAGGVHAGIDLSDGLSGDLLALCRESGVAARIEAEAVPVDPAVSELEPRRGRDPLLAALHGGEDYELLLAVEPGAFAALAALAGAHGTRLSRIGVLESGAPSVWLHAAGDVRPLEPRSHEHFAAGRRSAGAPRA